MKIIVTGDCHGRINWKDIFNKEKDCDKFIFIGDYFDTRTGGLSGDKQIENAKEIFQLKKDNPDKVILLFGNHDFHYIKAMDEQYSGYQPEYSLEIGELIEDAIKNDYVQMCYLHGKYFFSHAGLTKTWVKNTIAPNNIDPEVDLTMVDVINDFLKYKPSVFKFTVGEHMDMTGDDVTQSPIWVRPHSLLSDMIKDITCVVGHTPVRHISLKIPNLILTDCLGDTLEYLIINDGEPSIGRL